MLNTLSKVHLLPGDEMKTKEVKIEPSYLEHRCSLLTSEHAGVKKRVPRYDIMNGRDQVQRRMKLVCIQKVLAHSSRLTVEILASSIHASF